MSLPVRILSDTKKTEPRNDNRRTTRTKITKSIRLRESDSPDKYFVRRLPVSQKSLFLLDCLTTRFLHVRDDSLGEERRGGVAVYSRDLSPT